MAKKQNTTSTPEKHHYIFPIGFFEARRALKILKRLKSLVAYRFKVEESVLDLESWDKLELDSNKKELALESAINKLIWPVTVAFKKVGLKPVYTWQDESKLQLNVLKDIFNVPADKVPLVPKLLLQELERAIGLYEYRKKLRLKQAWKPTSWCAWLINMPARILRDSGVQMESEKTSKYYHLLLQSLTGLLLLLIIIKLGISIDVFKIFKLG